MRKSSKILLVICGALLVTAVATYFDVQSQSKPDFTRQDAATFLSNLAKALMEEKTNTVMNYHFPDAVVAGRHLQTIRDALQRGFSYVRDLKVDFRNLRYTRQGEQVILTTEVTASDETTVGQIYQQEVTIRLERRLVPKYRIFSAYEWKITNIEAPNIPL